MRAHPVHTHPELVAPVGGPPCRGGCVRESERARGAVGRGEQVPLAGTESEYNILKQYKW